MSVSNDGARIIDSLGVGVIGYCWVGEVASVQVLQILMARRSVRIAPMLPSPHTSLIVKVLFVFKARPFVGNANLQEGIFAEAMIRPIGVWLQLPVLICVPLVKGTFCVSQNYRRVVRAANMLEAMASR